jgi:hypothetical protein
MTDGWLLAYYFLLHAQHNLLMPTTMKALYKSGKKVKHKTVCTHLAFIPMIDTVHQAPFYMAIAILMILRCQHVASATL